MRDVTSQNFGLLIAYVLPGFTVLWGISHVSETVQSWIGTTSADAPTVGGFLYVTIASVAAGITVSTLRWLIVDTLHHLLGLKQPQWNLSMLGDRIAAFNTLIEIHYKFHQFYGGMVIALPLALTFRWSAVGMRWMELVMLAGAELLFFVSSRDALSKYYQRVDAILARS